MNANSRIIVGRWTDARRLLGGHRLDADERDRAEQRDPGAVELQERQAAEDHAEIDEEEDDDDGCGHSQRAAASPARTASRPIATLSTTYAVATKRAPPASRL